MCWFWTDEPHILTHSVKILDLIYFLRRFTIDIVALLASDFLSNTLIDLGK